METKAISSRPKEPRGPSMWLGTDRRSSLELSLGRKVRVEESVFQKGSTWEQNLQAGFPARNRSSQWLQLRPWSEHFPMGTVAHLLRSRRPQETANRRPPGGVTWRPPGGVTLSTDTCLCLLGECEETVWCAEPSPGIFRIVWLGQHHQ